MPPIGTSVDLCETASRSRPMSSDQLHVPESLEDRLCTLWATSNPEGKQSEIVATRTEEPTAWHSSTP